MEKKLPEGWEWKTIEDVSENIQYGFTESASSDRVGPKFLRITDIQNGSVDWNTVPYCKVPEKIKQGYLLRKGDIVFARTGATVGKSYRIGEEIPEAIFASYLIRLVPSDDVDSKYISYFLQTSYYWAQIAKGQVGAGQPSFNSTKLSGIKVPIPPLETQRKIIAILDKAEETKRLRAQSNDLTQKLLQAVFLEMFGDPIKNEKGWPVSNLSELISGKGSISCGPFGSQLKICEYVENGLPVLGIDNIEKDGFVWAKSKQITREKAEYLSQFRVNPGDLLISRTGTVGRACIVPEDLNNAIIGPNLLKIRFDRNKMEPEYFSMAINFIPSVIDEIAKISPGATVAVLNTTNLKRLRIAVPEIAIQRNFIVIKKRIEKIKILQRESFDQVNPLLKDLVFKAFSGELVA